MMPEDPYAYIVAAYQAPPSPDYIPGLEEPQSPPPLDFVPEPMYPEYMPLEDEMLPVEEQPMPTAALPTADSLGYVFESDLEEEPAEDDEDPEEDLADYPADRDDDDKEEEKPSRDDADEPFGDRPEITLPPQKRLGIDLGPRCKVGESSVAAAARPIGGRRADYGFVDTMDTEIRRQRAEEGDRAYCSSGAGHAGYLCCDKGYTGQADPDILE
ncbi:hypothetical protein Tco_1395233, partial [Tanacetum coccineum]